jgi:hypothetical protein
LSDDDASATATLATGTGDGSTTVRGASLVTPSLDAEMTADPAPTAAIIPLLSTVATVAFDVCHVIARPLNEAPAASRGTATPRAV